MSSYGIYTLANDVVYDQLVALLNSITVNVGADIPVCVIPFDDRCDRIRQEIATRPTVSLFENQAMIQRWETFARQVWAAHPATQPPHATRYATMGHHRKFVAFDGDFERFVFYDADSLAMKPIVDVLHRLDTYDFVFDDWEHRKQAPHTALDVAQIERAGQYSRSLVQASLHCSSFFGSKRSIFGQDELQGLCHRLIDQKEVQWIPRWWDDAFLFTYLTLRSDRPQFNFTQSDNPAERTGNCANADPFTAIDQVLYNQEGLKPIHRLHYMSYSSQLFTRLCQGEAVDIPHRDVFLYYRFLHQPDLCPSSLQPPTLLTRTNRQIQKAARKFKLALWS